MKNSIFAAALIILVVTLIGSCKKDDDSNPSGDTPKIKTHTFMALMPAGPPQQATATYVYDSEGRVSTVTYTGARTGVDLYTYTTDSVTILHAGDSYVYILNSAGYATENDFGPLSYDATWHLISGNTEGIPSGTWRLQSEIDGTRTWEEDNLTSIIASSDTITYTHWTDKTNTIGNLNRGIAFLGKDSKNLIKTKTSTYTGENKAYSYEYDSEGRVTVMNGDETFTYY